MKLLFCWDWTNSLDVIARLDEGIGEVLRGFAQDGHEVRILTWGGPAYGTVGGLQFDLVPTSEGYLGWLSRAEVFGSDLILGWGSIDHKVYPLLRERFPDLPMYLCLAGGPVDHPNAKVFTGFFVETQFHVDDLGKYHGKSAVKALGIMESVLFPETQEKVWDVLLPASFTSNKRYDLFADVVDEGRFCGVAVGPVNDEGCRIECQKVGIPTFGYVSRAVLRGFYNASRVTVLPAGAWGGCQRALLESLACGIPVVVCDDNFQLDWLRSLNPPGVIAAPPQVDLLIKGVRKAMELPDNPLTLRQFVLDRFRGQHYYQTVKQVMVPEVHG